MQALQDITQAGHIVPDPLYGQNFPKISISCRRRRTLDHIPQSDAGYKLLNDDQPPVLFPAVYDLGYAGDRVRLKILVDIGRVYVQDLLYIKPAGITVLHQIYIVRFIDRGNNLIK